MFSNWGSRFFLLHGLSFNSHIPVEECVPPSISFLYVEVIWGSLSLSSKRYNSLCCLRLFPLSNLTIFGHLLFFSVLTGILKGLALCTRPNSVHIVRFASWADCVASSDTQKNENKCKIVSNESVAIDGLFLIITLWNKWLVLALTPDLLSVC